MNIVKDYEADNITGYNHEGPVPNIPVKRLTATSIIGDKVENAEGENLGHIDNLMVNLRTGQVEYVVLQFGAFMGMGGKLFAIPFEELKLDPSREIFILNRDREYLKNMPGFDQAHWPDTNEHVYFSDVDNYWGATPIV
jgi:sporulation protein YlmC with PRC-barrel domain